MGRVRRVQVIVEVEAGDGVLTKYEVIGQTGAIYGKRTRIGVTPVYGNPGEAATQVHVEIDAMLIPIGSEQLVSITEHPLGPEELSAGADAPQTIVMRELPPSR